MLATCLPSTIFFVIVKAVNQSLFSSTVVETLGLINRRYMFLFSTINIFREHNEYEN